MNNEELINKNEKVSKGLAYYFGIASIIWGLMALIGLGYWWYMTQHESNYDFTWTVFGWLAASVVGLCGVGIFLISRKTKR